VIGLRTGARGMAHEDHGQHTGGALPGGGRRCPACSLCVWDAPCPLGAGYISYVVHLTLDETMRLHTRPAAAGPEAPATRATDGAPAACAQGAGQGGPAQPGGGGARRAERGDGATHPPQAPARPVGAPAGSARRPQPVSQGKAKELKKRKAAEEGPLWPLAKGWTGPRAAGPPPPPPPQPSGGTRPVRKRWTAWEWAEWRAECAAEGYSAQLQADKRQALAAATLQRAARRWLARPTVRGIDATAAGCTRDGGPLPSAEPVAGPRPPTEDELLEALADANARETAGADPAKVLGCGPTAELSAAHAGVGRALIAEAVAHLTSGSIDEGLAAALGSLEKLAGNPADAASAQYTVAAARLAKGEPKEALVSATEALTAFKLAGDKQMEAAAMRTCAIARIQLEEFAGAVATARNALAIYREIGDKDGEATMAVTLNDALVASEATAKADSASVAVQSSASKKKARKALAAEAKAQKHARSNAEDLRKQLLTSEQDLQDIEQRERRASEDLMRLSSALGSSPETQAPLSH